MGSRDTNNFDCIRLLAKAEEFDLDRSEVPDAREARNGIVAMTSVSDVRDRNRLRRP